MSKTRLRKPIAFDPDDPLIRLDEISASEPLPQPGSGSRRKKNETRDTKARQTRPEDTDPLAETVLMTEHDTPASRMPARLDNTVRSTSRWGTLLIAALGALVSFGIGLAVTDLVESLFIRADWLGWTGLGIAAIAGFALLMICIRELTGLVRLRRITRLRAEAAHAIRDNDAAAAGRVVSALKTTYGARPDCEWGLERLKEAESQVFDADDLLKIAERDLMKSLDARAAQDIARAVRRVSVVTAVSPATLIDMGYVLFANLSMLRRIADLYGGRPGAIGLFRLARMVLTHLTVTGGIAIGDGLLQQVFGHGLAAKLSARLGEGVLNGLFTARIGLAALNVCRPLPFEQLDAPTIKQLMSEVALPADNSEPSQKGRR